MKVIVPLIIDEPKLLSSSVPIDVAAWVETENYQSTPGQPQPRVREGVNEYVLKVAESQGQRPSLTPDSWSLIGVINRWRMFDPERGPAIQTVSPEPIVVVLKPGSHVNSIALLGLTATRALVEYFDEAGEEIYSREFQTYTPYGVSSYAKFFSARIARATRTVFDDLPFSPNGSIRVTIENGNSPAGVGKLVIGLMRGFGCTQYALPGDRKDLSPQSRDGFGNVVLRPVGTVRSLTFEVEIDSIYLDYMDSEISKLFGRAAVYIGSGRWSFSQIYGFPRDATPRLETGKKSKYTLKVEEL